MKAFRKKVVFPDKKRQRLCSALILWNGQRLEGVRGGGVGCSVYLVSSHRRVSIATSLFTWEAACLWADACAGRHGINTSSADVTLHGGRHWLMFNASYYLSSRTGAPRAAESPARPSRPRPAPREREPRARPRN